MASKKSFHQSLNVHRQVFTRHENKDEKKVDTQKSENYWNFQKIFFFFSQKNINDRYFWYFSYKINVPAKIWLYLLCCTYFYREMRMVERKTNFTFVFEIFFLPCQFKIWVTILVGFFYLFNLIFETIMLNNISSLNLSFMYHLTLQVTYESKQVFYRLFFVISADKKYSVSRVPT